MIHESITRTFQLTLKVDVPSIARSKDELNMLLMFLMTVARFIVDLRRKRDIAFAKFPDNKPTSFASKSYGLKMNGFLPLDQTMGRYISSMTITPAYRSLGMVKRVSYEVDSWSLVDAS